MIPLTAVIILIAVFVVEPLVGSAMSLGLVFQNMGRKGHRTRSFLDLAAVPSSG
jgi:hypothetical protein